MTTPQNTATTYLFASNSLTCFDNLSTYQTTSDLGRRMAAGRVAIRRSLSAARNIRRARLGEDSSIKVPQGAGRSQCGRGQSAAARGTRTDDCRRHSEEIHSPDECTRTVVRRRRPAHSACAVERAQPSDSRRINGVGPRNVWLCLARSKSLERFLAARPRSCSNKSSMARA
jgi:hypothetical protein